ncbi:MAG: TRAP transporter TatT component family protein [Acidobacteriota bacterium]|nr:TRAP transporter TatT component family protein [Acidobacteriota bacterium]
MQLSFLAAKLAPRLGIPVLVLLVPLLSTGCFVHRPAWETAPVPTAPRTQEERSEVDELVQRAEALQERAGDRQAVEAALGAWKAVLEQAPGHFEALDARSELYLLLGAAYARDREEQRHFYRRALETSEAALYTLPAFRRRVQAEEPFWQAVSEVGPEGMHSMHVWATAVFYLYRDTMGSARRVLNVRWLRRAEAVMTHMDSVDPDWSGGLLHFAWGMYYFALPPAAGGDKERAEEEIARALELGPDWIVYRWGRGRYLWLEAGNRQRFEEDLEWVLAQDPATAGSPYWWNVYFQREARELLDRADELFPAR